ncbi:restriction endonuclease [Geovibrio thiophilus]|uniref:Restriction endonuclease n=1 Tax=Geovibrio thiophilus TaxID=139438 RepID=A0A3R5XZD0_9BACT|nr:restriction endonuclease subunit S [Geovibrio thiophilus]QAR34422.1 restriction endonuclease [Geovibrio thiophilus]
MEKVKWGEFRLGDLFEINSYKKRFDANKVDVLTEGQFPYIVRMGTNNGQKGYINEDEAYLNEGNTISFGQDTATMFYQEKPYFTGDKIKIIKARDSRFNKKNAQFFISTMMKSFSSFSWGSSSFNIEIIKNQKMSLPVSENGEIDFEFMENFIAELEAERIAELEAYLSATGLNDYTLTPEELQALDDFESLDWQCFNIEKLFGKSTRGKRLKSADRISGTLPFVTAGEANEGVSAFIGNDVTVFSKNTITIDMFGSAKYRNYKYGGDDHIAVVHTETLPKYASIFVTTAIHKSSYTGEFHYGRNFYAKDADVLNIYLPTLNNQPDYAIMETFISAIHKLVIKDVVLYADRKIEATKTAVNKQT